MADTILPGQLLTAEGGGRFCAIATGTCGALRAGLFILTPDSSGVSEARQVAYANGNGHGAAGEALPAVPGVTVELLRKAATRIESLISKDLLVQAIWMGQPGPSEHDAPPAAFLVLQAAPRQRKGSLATGSFTIVDRQRARVICLLAALKEEARASSSQSEALARLSQALSQETTVDGKLRSITGFLSEATQSNHACLWLQPAGHGGQMRLRAVSGGEGDRLGPTEAPQDMEALQKDLQRISRFDAPAAIALSALPWLKDILGIGLADLGEAAIVTPLRRNQDAVGVAISATAPGTSEHAAATMAVERVGLLRALADQIVITSEIALTSIDAQDRIRRYSLLAAIGEIALSKLGMEIMLDSILMRVQDHFDATSVYLYLLGSERSALRTRSVHRPDYAGGSPFIEVKAHLISNDKRIGALQVRRTPASPFSGPDHETLAQVADQVALSLTTSARYQLQASLAVLDALTDLPNRRSAEAAFDRELERARQERIYLSIALLDIDHFKTINDTYGHETGDTVLRDIARMFKVQVRATDHVSRWGGEEFLILLPGSTREAAQRVCERIRHSASLVAARASNDKVIPVTASLGGATFPEDGEARETLLARADAALYRAKAAGRNRLFWAEHLE
ncbi:MAG TPA: GGDEF domain-containing protein [Chloroflexota bacterium]|nr:GGDEF domain-containing protein [Chloroflexota bacterium]